jgi:hypothetical protein
LANSFSGIRKSKLFAVLLLTLLSEHRMAPTDDFESDVLGEYVESLRTGKSRPYMKSLPVPKTQDGPVLKVRKTMLLYTTVDPETHASENGIV